MEEKIREENQEKSKRVEGYGKVEETNAEEQMENLPSDAFQADSEQISLNQVLNAISEVDSKLSQFEKMLAGKIATDETKGKLFERLYVELERYRQDFLFDKILRKLFLDLVGLFDRIDDVKGHFSSSGFESEDVISNLNSFCNEIVQILKNQEVFLIKKDVERFDETFQEAMDVEYTDRVEEDLRIARVIKRGFRFREHRVLRPEIVTVKRYKED